jgi:hypothetical protein
VVVDRHGLEAAVSRLPAGRLDELVALGVIIAFGPDQYCVPSPSLLGLLDDAVANGVAVDDAMAVVGAIATGVRGIAENVAATLEAALGDRADEEATVQLLRRGRVLVAQGTSRLLLHELSRAFTGPAGRPGDLKLAALVDRLRVDSDTAPPAKTRMRQTPGTAPDGQ